MTNEEALKWFETVGIILFRSKNAIEAMEKAREALELAISIEDGGEIMPQCK